VFTVIQVSEPTNAGEFAGMTNKTVPPP